MRQLELQFRLHETRTVWEVKGLMSTTSFSIFCCTMEGGTVLLILLIPTDGVGMRAKERPALNNKSLATESTDLELG